MKTAISLPDSLYEEAEETAKALGLPRSQLYAKALEEFLAHHNMEAITEKYDEVYKNVDSPSLSNDDSIAIQSLRELTKNDAW
jgi:metal-responsive CopG/Arc/MetJ family transcriptional regulator